MITKEQIAEQIKMYQQKRLEFYNQAQQELASYSGALLALEELLKTIEKE
jgi:hypothetical protein